MDERVLKLIGLHRAEFERLKVYERRVFRAEFAASALAAAGSLIPVPTITYLATLAALFTMGLRWYWSSIGRDRRAVAERCRRALVLTRGLGRSMSGKELADLAGACEASEAEGKRWEDKDYYAPGGEPGPRALALTIQESALFSGYLLQKSADQALWKAAVMIILSVVALLILPLFAKGGWLVASLQLVSLVLMFVISSGLIGTYQSYSRAAAIVRGLDEQLDVILAEGAKEADVIFVFGEYNAAVEGAPKVPTDLYLRHKDELNSCWEARRKGAVS